MKSNYKSAIVDAVRDLKNVERAITLKQESISSALYFIHENYAQMTANVITLDIGGRTSDITIWQGNTLRWRSSFKLAGQDLLIYYIYNYTDYLEKINPDAGNELKLLKEFKKERFGVDTFTMGIEIFVNSDLFKDTSDTNFHLVSGESIVENIYTLSELYLAGMLYYLGQVIKYFYQKDKFDLKRDFYICLGGKGSLIFKYLRDHSIRKLEEFFKYACGANREIHFMFSKKPKHEVAYGLLINDQVSLDDKKYQTISTIPGDQLIIEPPDKSSKKTILQPFEPIQDISAEDREWRVDDMPVFKDFLKTFIINFDKPFLPNDDRVYNRLKDEVNKILNEERNNINEYIKMQREKKYFKPAFSEAPEITKEENFPVVIEPVFIIALRKFIHFFSKEGLKKEK
jgi:hypothetical protein